MAATISAAFPRMVSANHFILFDNMLGVPALCYPLNAGWTGMGWIKWTVPAKTNPYLQSTILFNPSERRIVQEAGTINKGTFILEQTNGI